MLEGIDVALFELLPIEWFCPKIHARLYVLLAPAKGAFGMHARRICIVLGFIAISACGARGAQEIDRSTGDLHFARGAYRDAERAYRQEASSEETTSEKSSKLRIRFRLALAILAQQNERPNEPMQARAVYMLRQLSKESPGSVYARQANIVLAQMDMAARMTAQLETEKKRREDLKEMLGRLSKISSELGERTQQSQDYAELLSTERQEMETQIETLKSKLGRQDRRVRKLENQLDELKRIDMQR